ncbi:hypothetical protein ACVIGA_008446 [Bradyrhizobium sp. USDA 3240]
MVDRAIALAAAGVVIAAITAMPSSSVDLPVPFSPTMMLIALSKLSSNSSRSSGSTNGYPLRLGMRSGSSQTRLRYGAGMLIGRCRPLAIRPASGTPRRRQPRSQIEVTPSRTQRERVDWSGAHVGAQC